MKRIWEKKKVCEIGNIDRSWKEKNRLYLRELQSFFDRVDNIENAELRKEVKNQMLICDKVLTELAEEMFKYFYQNGYQKGKEG